MNLPRLQYSRQPQHLSPSSFALIERSPMEYFLQKCAPYEFAPPRMPATAAMQLGNLFDSRVKEYLGCDLKGNEDHDEVWKPEAIAKAEELFDFWMSTGAPQWHVDNATVPEPGTDGLVRGEIDGVPIAGYPDAYMPERAEIALPSGPLDWKVNGGFSKKGASPLTGWSRMWTRGDTLGARYPHPKASLPMDRINSQYADQLCIYGWLDGSIPTDFSQDGRCVIEQICCKPDGDHRVCQVDSIITIAYQRVVATRLKSAWTRIINEDVVDLDDTDPMFARLMY